MTLTIIESPYAGDIRGNEAYARQAMLDSIRRGETPFASHLLYTQVLDDDLPDERARGIAMGHEWAAKADLAAFYIDKGWSKGMIAAKRHYETIGLPFEERTI